MILQSPTFPRRQPPMMRASSSRIWKRSAILRSFHAIPPEADLMGGIGVVAPLLLHSAYDIIRDTLREFASNRGPVIGWSKTYAKRPGLAGGAGRSGERLVGKEGVSRCGSLWTPY